MRRALALLRSGAAAGRLHPLRSAVSIACVVAMLVPFVAGLGVSRGLRDEADDSLRFGGDVHVTGRRLGRDVPFPAEAADVVRALPGVTGVVPRIVAEVRLGADSAAAVLVGIPSTGLPASTALVAGRLFRDGAGGEIVVGSRLADRLGLSVGARVPPFHRNDAGERVSTVVGVFRAGLPVWEANLILASLATAEGVLGAPGLVTDLVVSCAPERLDEVRGAILRLPSLGEADAHGAIQPRVVTRPELASLVERRLLDREGVFDLHLLLVFAIGIPLLLVTSGVGLDERRRETSLLAATGWQMDELLVRALAESVLVALVGASLAILLAWAWLSLLGGVGVSSVFLSGVDEGPGTRVPFRLTPIPALLGTLFATLLVVTGSLLSVWRAASAPPSGALR